MLPMRHLDRSRCLWDLPRVLLGGRWPGRRRRGCRSRGTERCPQPDRGSRQLPRIRCSRAATPATR